MYEIGDEVEITRPFYLLGTGETIPIGTKGKVVEILEEEYSVTFPQYSKIIKLFPGEMKKGVK